jgi:YidC/Oxa1 family membrane protein insertase
MDNFRLILILAVAFLSMMIWQQWQVDYGPRPVTETSYEASQKTNSVNNDVNTLPAVSEKNPELPDVVKTNDTRTASMTSDSTLNLSQSQKIHVETDSFNLLIDTRGGSIVQVNLRKYPLSLDRPETEYPLLTELPSNFYIAQSGLIATDKKTAPTHDSVYRAPAEKFVMSDNQDAMTVDLVWNNGEGVEVTKQFIFQRNSHLIRINHKVNNQSGKNWSGRQYQQLQRARPQEDSGNAFIYTYTGGAIYSQEKKYEKIDFDEMDDSPLNRDIKGGWQAMLQHYFVSAWVPPTEEVHHYYSKALPSGRYVLGSYSPALSIENGQTANFDNRFYAGPKLQHDLEAISEGLDLTVDYGWLTIIAKPIFWVLEKIHTYVGNWGWAIILLTILIKAAFFKLSEASYKSMANMRKVAPRLQTLKERYGDDKQRLNQAMMEMYKKEKINPLGGCLPMLVQIPVFIALYWVLLESVEMRQAPWILWIDDLSIKDPYFVLPLLMGITMFIQQKLNPPPPDPMQAKIMMSLPVVFTVFFAFFPSGLVLYWFVNNLLSISQQWYITNKIEQAAKNS